MSSPEAPTMPQEPERVQPRFPEDIPVTPERLDFLTFRFLALATSPREELEIMCLLMAKKIALGGDYGKCVAQLWQFTHDLIQPIAERIEAGAPLH